MFGNYKSLPSPGLCLILVVCLLAFKRDEPMHRLAEQAQQALTLFHAPEPDSKKIRKCEITISDEGFLRYRKFYLNGKQEYYSLNLSRLKALNYLGTAHAGTLFIRTLEDDVIVQTYNDRAGNVDSMSTELNIDLKTIEPEDLSSLQRDLFEMKRLIEK